MSNINLRLLREERGLTQEQLAKELDVKRYNISDWEQGRTQPDIELIKKIATYFNVSTDYLLGKTNIKNAENDINLDDIEIGLFSEIKDMSDEMKEQIINYARFLKNQNKK